MKVFDLSSDVNREQVNPKYVHWSRIFAATVGIMVRANRTHGFAFTSFPLSNHRAQENSSVWCIILIFNTKIVQTSTIPSILLETPVRLCKKTNWRGFYSPPIFICPVSVSIRIYYSIRFVAGRRWSTLYDTTCPEIRTVCQFSSALSHQRGVFGVFFPVLLRINTINKFQRHVTVCTSAQT